MENFFSKLKILFALVVILFLLVFVFKASYRLYLLKRDFEKYNLQLSSLKEKTKELKREVNYLTNFNNLEVEARQQMNLVRRGEKVIVLLPKEKATSSLVKKERVPFWSFSALKEEIKKILNF